MQGVGAKSLFLRHDGHLELPCPKLLEGAGALGLKEGPNLAETRVFSNPGPKALAQAKPEWALAIGRWPKSIEEPLQAWIRLSTTLFLFEAREPLPETGGGSFSGGREAFKAEGKVLMLPSAHTKATSSSLSLLHGRLKRHRLLWVDWELWCRLNCNMGEQGREASNGKT